MKILTIKRTLISSAILGLSACGGSDVGNSAPVFEQTSYAVSLEEDTVFNGSVSATDADGDVIAFTVSTSPSFGALTVNADGTYIYTPQDDFNGEDSAVISVSDSIASATTTVNFSVNNVNDLPLIATSSIAVSSDGITTGQVNASDADGDALTYSLVSQNASGNVEIDSATGAFSYTAETLDGISGNFTVSVADGIGESVTAVIELTPSYVTNEDKLTYYYSSEHSHLFKAESYITVDSDDDLLAIADAEVSDAGYVDLAVGYAKAGFEDKTLSLIDDKILLRPNRARAYLDSSIEFDALDKIELANTLREQAIIEYNAYLAETGIANVTSTDAGFYNEVVRAYLRAGQVTKATGLLTTIQIYADTQKDQTVEETSAHRRFIIAAQETLEDSVTLYLSTPDTANFDNAMLAANYFITLVDGVSFNELSSGTRYENWRANWYGNAVRSAYLLTLQGSQEQKSEATSVAKATLAKLMSLYTDTVYDENNYVAVNEYAAETLSRFPTGLANAAGVFNALYPEYVTANKTDSTTGNLALDMVIEEEGLSDTDSKKALRDHLAFQLLIDAMAGQELDATISDIVDTFTNVIDDDRLIVETLVEQDANGDNDKRGAWLLHYAGLDDAASEVIASAMENLQSTAYLEDVGTSIMNVLGSQGCLRISELTESIAGDSESASAYLQQCAGMVDSQFSGEDILPRYKLQANAIAAIIYEQLNNDDGVDSAIAIALEQVGTFEDIDDIAQYHLLVANTLATIGHLDEAQVQWQALSATLTGSIDPDGAIEDQVDHVTTLFRSLDDALDTGTAMSYPEIFNLQEAIYRQAGLNDDYSTVRAEFTSTTGLLIDNLVAATSAFADSEKIDLYEDAIERYAQIRAFDKASSLAINDIYSNAEKEEQLAVVVDYQANVDDFPATTVANVDFDFDGKPNFFLQSASDTDISASGLTIDDDADNDGIVDPEDLHPLNSAG